MAGALWAWSRDRPVLTGILIGLGTATKLYPLFLLGGILIICLRRRRYADLALAAVWAAAAWLVANAPAYLTGKEQWKVFWSFNADRGPDLGSIWSVIAQAGDVAISHETVNIVVVGGVRRLVRSACWCSACAPRRRRGSPSSGS